MKFWDSSAVIPLIIEETASIELRACHGRDREMLVWWGTLLECHSAIARRERAGMLPAAVRSQASRALRELSDYWIEVEPVASIREAAVRLVRIHDLRAADALQLAAAVLVRPEGSGAMEFVCLDRRLAAAASKEGMAVVDGSAE